MNKIYVAGDLSYGRPFEAFGEVHNNFDTFVNNTEEHCLVVFTGGEDISPSLYGHETNQMCGYTSAKRDAFEQGIFAETQKHQIPVAGICRGGQFLTAMAGGTLVQHCDSHGGNHDLKTNDGRIIEVTSTHHQMFIMPEKAAYVQIAWSSPTRSCRYFIGADKNPVIDIGRETDCAYYPEINALAMQYHPEYMSQDSEGFKFSQELVEKYLGLSKNWRTQNV